MYSISIFILHFTYLGGEYAPNTRPCLWAWCMLCSGVICVVVSGIVDSRDVDLQKLVLPYGGSFPFSLNYMSCPFCLLSLLSVVALYYHFVASFYYDNNMFIII